MLSTRLTFFRGVSSGMMICAWIIVGRETERRIVWCRFVERGVVDALRAGMVRWCTG